MKDIKTVIGNHDQDGKALYKRKWEDSFGLTDFSFDRGDEHYVCINRQLRPLLQE